MWEIQILVLYIRTLYCVTLSFVELKTRVTRSSVSAQIREPCSGLRSRHALLSYHVP
jgi:hypothetical protein